MANPSSIPNDAAASLLIGGAYEVDPAEPVPFGGGQPAFAVRDHRHGRLDLMAVQAAARFPARPTPLSVLPNLQIENAVLPIDHGRGRLPGGGQGWFVVMSKPAGSALVETGVAKFPAWREAELIDFVLRPMALALDQLAAAGVTHRAIRLNNLFRVRSGRAVTLGCGWAAPPASLQPAMFEPPYAASCHPAGRGEGTIADDVYALGVVLLALAQGRMPMAGMDDAAVVAAKLERGCFAALAGDARIPQGLADIVRGMLAEDPDHRPAPVLLADPLAARARRVAARPPQRAQRPIAVGSAQVWDARGLSHAVAVSPEQAIRLLRGMTIDTWLRRTLGDPAVATRIEEAVRLRAADRSPDTQQADAMLVMRAVAVLDPLAPLCWRGLMLFPDAMGPVLAYEASEAMGRASTVQACAEAIIQLEAGPIWAEARQGRSDPGLVRLDTRQQRLLLRIAGWAGGAARLRYSLNPLLSCGSRVLGRECVVRLADLLPALERQASSVDTVIDQEVAGFIAARFTGRLDTEFAILAQPEDADIDPPGHRALAQLRILAALCAREPAHAWPALCGATLRAIRPALKQWRGRSGRAAREAALVLAAERGSLVAMLAVLEDRHAKAQDARSLQAAEAELREIDSALEELTRRRPMRVSVAGVTGQEIAAAIGAIALASSAVWTALP